MDRQSKIVSSLIIGISIILSVLIFSFKSDLRSLFTGPDMDEIKEDLNIPDVGFTESLKESYDILMELWGENAQYSNFVVFRNRFLEEESKFIIPFKINESIIWLPIERKEEILNDEVNFIPCKVFIYKQDTLFVPEKGMKKFHESVPKAKMLF